MDKIVSILQRRDGMSREEAEELIAKVRRRAFEGEALETLLITELGLSPSDFPDLL